MKGQPATSRLTLRRATSDAGRGAFVDAVRTGLTARDKNLPCRFFYDDAGAELFDQICELPEYYLTRAESQILRDCVAAIADRFPRTRTIIELGSGNAIKTEVILEEFLRRQDALVFCPIDVCEPILHESGSRLVRRYSGLRVNGVVGEYEEAWRLLLTSVESPKLVLWLGSNIGNLDRAAAAEFLRRLAAGLGPGDGLLIGIDLRKDPVILHRAYNDAAGVTAAFNKNLLARINRELGGEFDLTDFDHRARYVEPEGRIEMHLVSHRDLAVPIRALNMTVTFARGESIHTEDSYKYCREEIATLHSLAGLGALAWEFDDQRCFVVVSARPHSDVQESARGG